MAFRHTDPNNTLYPTGIIGNDSEVAFRLSGSYLLPYDIMLAGSLLSVVAFVAIGVGAAPASVLLVAVAALMMGVASLAALGPARRSLRLPTVEALRFDG